MVARTDLAWRILQIVALALPALAILVQVLLQMERRDTFTTPHHYRVSSMMLFLLVPMTGVGITASVVLFLSYEVLWLRGATALMGVSFLFVPLFLFIEYRVNRGLFKNEYLEREKDAIEEAAESGEMSEDEANAEIEKIESWQDGVLSWLWWRYGQFNEFLDHHPTLDLTIHGGMLIWWIYIAISDKGIFMTILAIPIALYAIAHILGHFIDLEIEEE